jgi:hypothetical protein
MKHCEIYHAGTKGPAGWKWRHRPAAGRVIESKETYALYYECVSAALEHGYLPALKCFLPGDGANARPAGRGI